MRQEGWPEWWSWDLELTSHLYKRMEDRGFTEVDLRAMLAEAMSYHEDVVEGRWVITARLRGSDWEVIVEPDAITMQVVVITAYPL